MRACYVASGGRSSEPWAAELSPPGDLGVSRDWLRGRPLTDFRRRRRNLPLPLERVKRGGSGARCSTSAWLLHRGCHPHPGPLPQGRGRKRRPQRGLAEACKGLPGEGLVGGRMYEKPGASCKGLSMKRGSKRRPWRGLPGSQEGEKHDCPRRSEGFDQTDPIPSAQALRRCGHIRGGGICGCGGLRWGWARSVSGGRLAQVGGDAEGAGRLLRGLAGAVAGVADGVQHLRQSVGAQARGDFLVLREE